MTKLDILLAWRDTQIPGELFMGIPDVWYDKPTWACESGHISRRYLKSEQLGNVCLACMKTIVLVPTGTTEDKLNEILKGEDNES